jgi:hypothetical protein
MLSFNKLFKLYLFKNKSAVDLCIKVTDSYVQTYTIPQEQFEELIINWQKPEGYGILINNVHINVQYKRHSPRPESQPVSYVKITIYNSSMRHNFRCDLSDLIDLEKDYYYQVNNKMYWD